MKVGVFMYTQNSWDNERFTAYEADPSNAANAKRDADNKLWVEDLRFAEMVEDLGFDDLWTVEHHFSPYAQTTNPLQYLAYFAGKTKRIGLGTMVVVIPWHHPLRIAEEMVTLQYMLGTDRDLTIGFGRGAARREYGGFGIPQGESKERFDEGYRIIELALSQERFSYDGRFYKIPDVEQRPQSPHLSLRPTPLDPQKLLDNMYGVWGSPASGPRLAGLGLKPMIIPQRAMTEYESELGDFYEAGAANGHGAYNPIIAQWVYCSNDADAVARGHRAMAANGASGDVNYEFSSGFHKDVPGYEQYGERFEKIGKLMADNPGENVLLQDAIVGNPEQCLAKIQELSDLVHPRQWNLDFKFGDLTNEEAVKSIELFAEEVLPEVRAMEVKAPKVRAAA